MYFERRKLSEISVMSDTAREMANWRAAGKAECFRRKGVKYFNDRQIAEIRGIEQTLVQSCLTDERNILFD